MLYSELVQLYKQLESTTKRLQKTNFIAEFLKKIETLLSQPLTIIKVLENLQKTASLEGDGTVDRKIQLIAELLTSASAEEARYIARTFLEDLRIGVGEG